MRKVLIFVLVMILMCNTLSGCAYKNDDNDPKIRLNKTENQQTSQVVGDSGVAAEQFAACKDSSDQNKTLSFVELNSLSAENTLDAMALGDINQNGIIDSMDYVLLKRAYFGTYDLDKQDGNDESSTIEIENHMPYSFYDFDSYEEIKRALTDTHSVIYSDLKIASAQLSYRDVYRQTLEAYGTKKIKMSVPRFNGNLMKLRNLEGFSNITFFSRELFNLPWIWYDCKVNGSDLRIKVSNISIIDNKELRAADSYCNALSLIAPDAPSPSNYKDYESYSSIYEKDIVLSGGQTVKAMICELKDSSNIYVMFYKDDVLVILYADAELFTDSFWESFDIAPY